MNAHLLSSLLAMALVAPVPGFAHEPVVVIDSTPIQLAAADDYRAHADAWKRWADDFSRELRGSMGPMFAGRVGPHKVVKDAPYAAQVITESNQALSDGNVISRKTQGAIYRDGQGRVRQEMPGDGKEPTVYITDPVAGNHYILTPGSKSVISMRGLEDSPVAKAGDRGEKVRVKEKQVVRVGDREVRVEDGHVYIDGKEAAGGKVEVVNSKGRVIRVENGKVTIDGKDIAAPETPEAPGVVSKIVVKTIESGDAPDGTRREEVRVQVIRPGEGTPFPPMPPVPPVPPVPAVPPPAGFEYRFDHPMQPLPAMPGVHTFRFENMSRLGKGVTTNLGVKDFDGVRAEGKSTVWTIPAGEVGNRNPINVTSEAWYSNDLQVTLLSRYNDPRTGESIYRLASIRRGEPSPELFKVPADYTVKRLPGGHAH
jgi:hypothetical protein